MDTPNWFANDGQKNFAFNLGPYAVQKCRMLQIGAFTGDASVWLAENILKVEGSVLVDVDTWHGSNEPSHHQMDWNNVETQYDWKTAHYRNQRKIVKFKGTSDWFFKNNLETYDFIYIDGDHTSYGVLKDAVAAYECLNEGGILAFDDYEWSAGLGLLNEPRMAIDAFAAIYSERVELIVSGYQRWFRKIR